MENFHRHLALHYDLSLLDCITNTFRIPVTYIDSLRYVCQTIQF